MKRKTIKTVGLSVLAFCAIILSILLGFQIKRHNAEKAQREQIELKLQDFPCITLSTADSIPFNLGDLCAAEQSIVIFYFHPECEFCQLEINELLAQKELLDNVLPVFVTFASPNDVAEFERTNPISTIDNSVLLFDRKFVLSTEYGIQSPPQTLIYNGEGHLVKHFRGFVMINDLLQVLQGL